MMLRGWALKNQAVILVALLLPLYGDAAQLNWNQLQLQDPISLVMMWGHGPHTVWHGDITVQNGDITGIKPYKMEKADHIVQRSTSRAAFYSVTAGGVDGCKLEIDGSANTVLVFHAAQGVRRVPLKSLFEGQKAIKLDRKGRMLWIHRSSQTVIRFKNLKEDYIFPPNSTWSPSVVVQPGFKTSQTWSAKLTTTIVSHAGSVVRSISRQTSVGGGTNVLDTSVPIPAKQGGYLARFRVSGLPFYVPPLNMDFLVLSNGSAAVPPTLDAQGVPSQGPILEQTIACANTSEPSTFRSDGTDRVDQYGTVAFRETGRTAHQIFRRKAHRASSNWFAYKLAVRHPGTPYLLRIVYPKNLKQRFVVSILDRNDSKIAVNVLDEMVTSSGDASGGQFGKKDIVFWPRRHHVGVLIVNALNGHPAAVRSIKLYRLPSASLAQLPSAPCKSRAVYYEEPVFARQFGGSQPKAKFVATRDGTLPDWANWYLGAKRLVELMANSGYTRLMIPVYGYGSALYPSAFAGQGTRYVSGVKFADHREPVRPDVVRLLLTLLQRHHMTLVPIFEFYGRVARLDAGAGTLAGLRNAQGRLARTVLRLRNPDIGPYYDPLDPRVQKWVADVLSEFLKRYGAYSSLGDVAIQLNTSGWIQYPGPDWGYAKSQVRQFADSLSMQLPSPLSARDAALWVRDNGLQSQWLMWRNNALVSFYKKLAALVSNNSSQSKLAFSYMNIFSSRYSQRSGYLKRPDEHDLRSYLANRGIDPLRLASIPGTVILRPIRLPIPKLGVGRKRPEPSLTDAARKLFAASGASGVVVFHDYYETWLPSLKNRLWWPTRYWMVASYYGKSQLTRALKGSAPSVCYDGGYQIPQY